VIIMHSSTGPGVPAVFRADCLLGLVLLFPVHRQLPQESLKDVRAQLRTASTRAIAAGAQKQVIARIGLAQTDLHDLEGALRTAEAVDPLAESDSRGRNFGIELMRLQVRSGQSALVLKKLESLKNTAPSLDSRKVVLAIARALAQSGDQAGAATLCREAARAIPADSKDPFDRSAYLFDIAQAQVDVGDRPGARATVRELATLAKDFRRTSNHVAWLYGNLGLLYAGTGDAASAQKAFQRALQELDPQEVTSFHARKVIAARQAQAQDLQAALATAKAIPATDDDRGGPWDRLARADALQEIAQVQLSRGDVEGAQGTVALLEDGDDRDKLRLEIAKSLAGAGKVERALKVASQIEHNPTRKAEAMLEVAAILGRKQRKRLAQEIARSVTYPDLPDLLGVKPAIPFDYKNLDTWGLPYLSLFAFTGRLRHWAEESEGDLAAAAMRCRVALEGHVTIGHPKGLHEWHVRKVAAAQAAAGDVKGALAWLNLFDDEARRLDALLSVAEGVARWLEAIGLAHEVLAPKARLAEQELAELWSQLASDDPGPAERAVWRLALGLRDKTPPASP
jgi:tetratricopeptide (TPR) repeat protein